MCKYKRYEEWISDQKIVSFVDFLMDQEQNGSSISISFEKFIEMAEVLFILYFVERYIWDEIVHDLEVYRDFVNQVESCYEKY